MKKNEYTIKYVDGFDIRNLLDSEFGIVENRKVHRPHPRWYVPEGEVWIDSYVKDETDFFMRLIELEDEYLQADTHFHAFRDKIKKELASNDPVDLDVITKKTYRDGEYLVRELDGGIVRKDIDPYFVLGGHFRVYDYIPKGEIWLDSKMPLNVLKYTLIHERVECMLMGRELNYDISHDYATSADREMRRQDGIYLALDDADDHKKIPSSEKSFIELLLDKDILS